MTEETETSPVALSFEFFPANDAVQERRFWRTVGCLETLQPDFFSMTYTAKPDARERAFKMVRRLCDESTVPVAAHLTCAGKTLDQLNLEIDTFATAGIRHIVALRGDHTDDAAKQETASPEVATCRYASDLVGLLGQRQDMQVSVAAYPEVHPDAVSASSDLDYLQQKLELGAQRAITQFFFNPDVFLRFRDRASASGIQQAIVPGILPIHDIEKVVSFSQRCGATVPVGVVDDFRVWAHDKKASRELALAHCLALCETLRREGVDRFHFYTLNQSDLAFDVASEMKEKRASSAIAAA